MLFGICISRDSQNRCRMGRFGCFQSDCRFTWSKSGNFACRNWRRKFRRLHVRWTPAGTRSRFWISFPQKYRSHSHLMFSEVSRTNSIRKWEWTSCNTDNEVNFVWCYINFALPGSIISFFPFLAPQKIYISEMCQISHKRKWMMKFE